MEDETNPSAITRYKRNRVYWGICRGHQISPSEFRAVTAIHGLPQTIYKETSIKVFDGPHVDHIRLSSESSSQPPPWQQHLPKTTTGLPEKLTRTTETLNCNQLDDHSVSKTDAASPLPLPLLYRHNRRGFEKFEVEYSQLLQSCQGLNLTQFVQGFLDPVAI